MKNIREKDLTQGGILRNLVLLSLPIVFSNFLQTFYNLTDAYWLGKIGDNARDAVAIVGLAFPIIFFLSSFGIGFSISGTALISRFKGAGEHDKIRKVIGQLVLVFIAFTTVFLVLSLMYIGDILILLKVPDEILETATIYMTIMLVEVVFMFTAILYQSISHGLGDTISPMIIQIVAVSINVLIDPVFIFGLLGMPRMEAVGAAYATLLARGVGAIIAVIFLLRRSKEHLPGIKDLKPSWTILKTIFKISIPASLSMSMTSFGFVFLQGFVNSFGTAVISVNSIGNRMTSFFMMPAMGISHALSAIVGQNLGAGNIERVKKSFYSSFYLVMSILALGAVCVYFWGADLTRFFIDDPEVIEIGVRMFRLTAFATFIFGIVFVFDGLFNGAGKTGMVFMYNTSRLWLFRIPLVFILSGSITVSVGWIQHVFSVFSEPLADYPYDALWWSMIISNLLSAVWAFYLYKKGSWQKDLSV